MWEEMPIREIYICYPIIFHLLQIQNRVAHSVAVGTNRELFELHNILCQSSSLIREYVVHSPKFLVKVWRLSPCRHVFFHVINRIVLLNEVRLEELDDFEGDYEGNRYNIHYHEEPRSKLHEEEDNSFVGVRCFQIQIRKLFFVNLLPDRAEYRTNETHDELDQNDQEDVGVSGELEFWELGLWLDWIHHDLSFMTSEDH